MTSLSDTWTSWGGRGMKKRHKNQRAHMTRSHFASHRHACMHTNTLFTDPHCFRSTWCYQTLPFKNQWLALTFFFNHWKEIHNQNRDTNSYDSFSPSKKNVHDEWQISLLVQFNTGMTVCMFLSVCVPDMVDFSWLLCQKHCSLYIFIVC